MYYYVNEIVVLYLGLKKSAGKWKLNSYEITLYF